MISILGNTGRQEKRISFANLFLSGKALQYLTVLEKGAPSCCGPHCADMSRRVPPFRFAPSIVIESILASTGSRDITDSYARSSLGRYPWAVARRRAARRSPR